MILTKLGQHVNEIMAVAVNKFHNFLWSGFFIIRQNINMATNAILHCGLTSKKVLVYAYNNRFLDIFPWPNYFSSALYAY